MVHTITAVQKNNKHPVTLLKTLRKTKPTTQLHVID